MDGRAPCLLAPPRIRPGDAVAVLAPAGPVDAGRLAAGLAKFGGRYDLRIDPTTQSRHGFLSAPDEARLEALQGAFRDPDIRAVFVARGGHGLTRILGALDASDFRADPKPIVGFSDATALLHWAMTHGVRSIHGPVSVQFGDLGDGDLQALVRLLESPSGPGPMPWPLADIGLRRSGLQQGQLVGGNLCVLSHLVGTPWLARGAELVWLLEDVGERPYAIDRYLTHLGNAGILARGQGALVGDFARCADDPNGPLDDTFAVIDERLTALEISGLVGAPIGHDARNAAVPMGAAVILDFDRKVIAFQEGAVS